MSGREASAVDRALGKAVHDRRRELGVSQEALASALGITFQQVQKYEKGTNRIAASRLYDISRALKMPVGDFYADLTAKLAARRVKP